MPVYGQQLNKQVKIEFFISFSIFSSNIMTHVSSISFCDTFGINLLASLGMAVNS